MKFLHQTITRIIKTKLNMFLLNLTVRFSRSCRGVLDKTLCYKVHQLPSVLDTIVCDKVSQ